MIFQVCVDHLIWQLFLSSQLSPDNVAKKSMKMHIMLMKRYRQQKKKTAESMKQQKKMNVNGVKKSMKKTQSLAARISKTPFKQPEPRKFRGVVWNKRIGVWMAVQTHPPGHKPRQEYWGCHSSQAKCAELLAKQLKCSVKDLLLDRNAREGKALRLYKGVFYHVMKKRWMAQVTYPAGHTPRQEIVGQGFSTQKAAAQALAVHLGVDLWALRLKKEEFYRSGMAVRKALGNFKVLQNLFVKKKMIPGRAICLTLGWVSFNWREICFCNSFPGQPGWIRVAP